MLKTCSEDSTPGCCNRASQWTSCTVSLQSDGLASIPSYWKLVSPRKSKAKHNHVGHDFKFPKPDFFCILFCVWSMASLTSAAAEKFQHAYKSCTKNKSNVKLLTASEKIGLSDSAITTWELFDRKRESIQFSRVEHHPLAICYLAKFCLILYTLSLFWDQWSGNRSYGVFNHVQFLELSVLITEWILSWKTTCINMRSTEVFILDNALINWHVFCLFFKNRSKSPYLTLSCHSQGLPGSSWSL